MKKYKIYTSGNVFYLVEQENGNLVHEANKKDVLIKQFAIGDTAFYIQNVANWKFLTPIEYTDIEDGDGVAYTLQGFIDFKEAETGNFNSASGGSDALAKFTGVTTFPLPYPPYTPTVQDTGFIESFAPKVDMDVTLVIVDFGTVGNYTIKSFDGTIDIFTVINGIISVAVTQYISAVGEKLLLSRRAEGCYITVL